jgi:hypothetical protein
MSYPDISLQTEENMLLGFMLWPTSHNVILTERTRRNSNTSNFFFFFYTGAVSKTNNIFVRQCRCGGRTQIGNKLLRRIFGPKRK